MLVSNLRARRVCLNFVVFLSSQCRVFRAQLYSRRPKPVLSVNDAPNNGIDGLPADFEDYLGIPCDFTELLCLEIMAWLRSPRVTDGLSLSSDRRANVYR